MFPPRVLGGEAEDPCGLPPLKKRENKFDLASTWGVLTGVAASDWLPLTGGGVAATGSTFWADSVPFEGPPTGSLVGRLGCEADRGTGDRHKVRESLQHSETRFL